MTVRAGLFAAAAMVTLFAAPGAARAELAPDAMAAVPMYPSGWPTGGTGGGTASLQAGGLAPPPPMVTQPGPAPSHTQQQLDQARRADAGRKLEWAYVNVEGGFQQVGLSTFNADDQTYQGFLPTSASGGVIGAGVGARVLFFTLGARGRIGFFSAYDLYTVGGEVGFHIPLGVFEPHFEAGAGYATLGNVSGVAGDAGMTAHGYYLRIGAGLDYYVTPYLSVGLNLSSDVLGLTRPALTDAQVTKLQAEPGLTETQRANAVLLAHSGSSNGSSIVIDALVGLHF